MEGRDVTGQFEAPVDVVCDRCKFIVATFYREPVNSEMDARRQHNAAATRRWWCGGPKRKRLAARR
jgi:hypothetical protein